MRELGRRREVFSKSWARKMGKKYLILLKWRKTKKIIIRAIRKSNNNKKLNQKFKRLFHSIRITTQKMRKVKIKMRTKLNKPRKICPPKNIRYAIKLAKKNKIVKKKKIVVLCILKIFNQVKTRINKTINMMISSYQPMRKSKEYIQLTNKKKPTL